VGAGRRGCFPVRKRLHVEAGLELGREILVTVDHRLQILAIEVGAVFLRQVLGNLPVLVVELSRPFDRLS
jgi:hypothetical protein